MKKVLIMLILWASAVWAEQVPVEVQKAIDNAMSGKDPEMVSFNMDAVSIGLEKGTKLSDLKAGVPIHLYTIVVDSLKNRDENAAIKDVIMPMDRWAVPLLEHGKPTICLKIAKIPPNPNWHAVGYGYMGVAKRWAKVCKAWPESAGYHPIYIGNLGGGPMYFHVPEKSENNLSPLFHYGSKSEEADSLYATLGSAKGLLGRIKAHMQANSKEGPK